MAQGTVGFAATQHLTQRMATGYAIPAPGANTNILTASITFSPNASLCRLYVVLATASVMNYYVTDGTTAYTVGINNSVALPAGDGQLFYFPVSRTDDGTSTGTLLTYNFRVETDGIIRQIIVDEILGD